MKYLPLALTYLGGLVAALMVIAPITPATWDDKLLAALQKLLAAVKIVRAPKP
jgi:hypothetical protein